MIIYIYIYAERTTLRVIGALGDVGLEGEAVMEDVCMFCFPFVAVAPYQVCRQRKLIASTIGKRKLIV